MVGSLRGCRNRQWSGTYYSGKLVDWPLTQTLTEEDVRDLAEYCLMFFADLSEEQMELLDQIETPGPGHRPAGGPARSRIASRGPGR